MALFVIVLPGAYALDYSYTFGGSAGENAGSYSLGGAATISLTGSPTLNTAENHLFASGSISASRSANSGNGQAHARSYFSVVGPSARTIYDFSSGTSYTAAQTTESLSSYNAHSIYAYGEAWNSNYDDALGSIYVTSPADDKAALLDYWNSAYAYRYSSSSGYASVSQGCAWADVRDYSNGYIFTSLYGKEGGGDWSKTTLNMPFGTINNPYPSWPYNTATAYGSRSANSGKGQTYARQSTNAYASYHPGYTGYFFAQTTAKRVGYSQLQDNDYFLSGTHTIGQYAWTTYPSGGANNYHYI